MYCGMMNIIVKGCKTCNSNSSVITYLEPVNRKLAPKHFREVRIYRPHHWDCSQPLGASGKAHLSPVEQESSGQLDPDTARLAADLEEKQKKAKEAPPLETTGKVIVSSHVRGETVSKTTWRRAPQGREPPILGLDPCLY